jgi:hypothetical protein
VVDDDDPILTVGLADLEHSLHVVAPTQHQLLALLREVTAIGYEPRHGQLPNVPPAHGRSLNVPEVDLVDGGKAAQDEGFDGFQQVSDNLDVRMMKTLMTQPANGGGQLHAATRGGDGRHRATTTGLTVLDVPEGRWMSMTTTMSGQRWVIAAPAGPQLLVSKLYELLRELA